MIKDINENVVSTDVTRDSMTNVTSFSVKIKKKLGQRQTGSLVFTLRVLISRKLYSLVFAIKHKIINGLYGWIYFYTSLLFFN